MIYYTIKSKNEYEYIIDEVEGKEYKDGIRYGSHVIDKSILDEKFWDSQFPNLYSSKDKALIALKCRLRDSIESMTVTSKSLKNDLKDIEKSIQRYKKVIEAL